MSSENNKPQIKRIDTFNYGAIEVGVDNVSHIIHECKRVAGGISSTYNVFDNHNKTLCKITAEEVICIKLNN